MHATESTVTNSETSGHRSSPLLGVLPFIGVILFIVSAVPLVFGDRTGDWTRDLVQNGVIYMIGWAGIGGGISHLFFGRKISASIGWATSPYEFEVGFANLGMGVAGVLAGMYSKEYWLALIIVTAIFWGGCGIGHVRRMVQDHDFAPNNTLILFVNFVVTAFLVLSYIAWA